jgi:hypothetical protein
MLCRKCSEELARFVLRRIDTLREELNATNDLMVMSTIRGQLEFMDDLLILVPNRDSWGNGQFDVTNN